VELFDVRKIAGQLWQEYQELAATPAQVPAAVGTPA
jgi:hypothetical protein